MCSTRDLNPNTVPENFRSPPPKTTIGEASAEART